MTPRVAKEFLRRAPPVKKAIRSRTRSNGEMTRERILDAAEALFGERTFDTVSLRDITDKAGVTLALASYHFGSKERLFTETVARRAEVLNLMRRERLTALTANDRISVTAILDAFMRPLFDQMRVGSDGWQSYLLIISKLAQGNRWLQLLRDHFDPTARLFLASLRTALPDVPEPSLLRGFSLALDCMLQTLSKNRRVDSLSDGAVSADDLGPAYDTLLKFAVHGFNGLREGLR